MNRFKSICILLFMGAMILFPLDFYAFDLDSGPAIISYADSYATGLESRYAVITYADSNDLRKFNAELYMGRLASQIGKGRMDTIEDEVISKVDFIVEKVMATLDMFPQGLKFSIVIHLSERQVQKEFQRIYNVDVDYIAFYSPSQNTVFYSAENATLRVVAHEIAHVVAEKYFTVSPPQRIHEVMAQFAEQHITD